MAGGPIQRPNSILLLCDGGGGHNSTTTLQGRLATLVNRLGISIRVAGRYSPHCSKYNPIEHRLFPHVTRAWSGCHLSHAPSSDRVPSPRLTRTGLKLTYAVLDKVYPLKREASQRFLDNFPIRFDQYLPDWNYTIVPNHY